MKRTYTLILFILLTSQSFGQLHEFRYLDSLQKIEGFYVNDTLMRLSGEGSWALSVKADTTKLRIDPEFVIMGVSIIDTQICISFAYGGGCGPAKLRLYLNESTNFKKDPVIELFPEFKDEDMCRAIKFGSANFDISKLSTKRRKPLIIKVGTFELLAP